MGNISGCGSGGWTQVLKINGTKVSFNDFTFHDLHGVRVCSANFEQPTEPP